MMSHTAHPPITSREEWLSRRRELLTQEKELTKSLDRVNALRRRLPMVQLDTAYVFEGLVGHRSLLDLFDGQRQLIVYHFMFDPEWDKGCAGCTSFVDALGDLSMLGERNTSFVLVSRAPFAKLEKYRQQKGWPWPWYSSFGSTFNYDFHVTLDESVAPVEYNYRSKSDSKCCTQSERKLPIGESHGLSVFFQHDDKVFHT